MHPLHFLGEKDSILTQMWFRICSELAILIMSRMPDMDCGEVALLGKLVTALVVEAVILIVYLPFILKKLIIYEASSTSKM